MSDFWWSPENVERLTKLWGDGLSSSQIASRIGGCTRNSVIGKVHRLGLSGRATTVRSKSAHCSFGGKKTSAIMRERAKQQVRAKVKAEAPDSMRIPREPMPPQVATDIARVSFADIEPGQCRFIPGDPKAPGPMFCGCETVPGTSYCPGHLARCYVTPKVATSTLWHDSKLRKGQPADSTRAVDELLEDREHA